MARAQQVSYSTCDLGGRRFPSEAIQRLAVLKILAAVASWCGDCPGPKVVVIRLATLDFAALDI